MKGRSLVAMAIGLAVAGVAFGGTEYNGHSYSLTNPVGSWLDAEALAVASGGHLVTINDAAENTWLFTTFLPSTGVVTEAEWIGLYQLPGSIEPDQGWVWISGESSTYRNWTTYQPDNFGGDENYGVFDGNLTDTYNGGTWVDNPVDGWPHGSQFRGIVEKTPDTAATLLLVLAGLAGVAACRARARRT